MPKYILFDTETTGNATEDRIIQVGAMVVDAKAPIEVYDELCSSEIPIKIEAMEVHNITPEMIADKAPYSQTNFAKRLNELNTNENFLIAHNINFDLGMIEKEGFKSNLKHIDTLRSARHLFDELPYHRLQYLRYALELYKIENAEAKKNDIVIKAHDAIGDVLVMKLFLSKLVARCKERFPGINPMDKLVELTKQPVLVKEFRFGKYKGKLISEVATMDSSYLNWMKGSMELDEDMQFTLETYLNN